MVMPDPVRPGVVPTPNRSMEDRVRALELALEAQNRKDMTNSTVGQGGTFRGFYDTGGVMFTFGADKDDDGIRKVRVNYALSGRKALQIGPGNPKVEEPEQLQILDQAGNKIFATDGFAGYGLAEPSFSYAMYSIPGLNYVAGVEQAATISQSFFYNPGVWSQIFVRAFTGTVTSLSCRLRVTNGQGETVTSSAWAAGANSFATRIVLLPSNFINNQNAKAEWLVTSTGAGTAEVGVRMCKGTSKFFYDVDTGDH